MRWVLLVTIEFCETLAVWLVSASWLMVGDACCTTCFWPLLPGAPTRGTKHWGFSLEFSGLMHFMTVGAEARHVPSHDKKGTWLGASSETCSYKMYTLAWSRDLEDR